MSIVIHILEYFDIWDIYNFVFHFFKQVSYYIIAII